MNRREFIVSASGGFFAAAFTPLPALLAPTAKRKTNTWFAVGSAGEFDWQAILAPDLRTAKLEWLADQVDDLEDAEELESSLDGIDHYVPSIWQDLQSSPSSADWFRAGMGHVCDRCGNEAHGECGGLAVADEAVCETCLTLPDLCIADQESAIEELTDLMIDVGVSETRLLMVERSFWALIPIHIWSAAVNQARKFKQST